MLNGVERNQSTASLLFDIEAEYLGQQYPVAGPVRKWPANTTSSVF